MLRFLYSPVQSRMSSICHDNCQVPVSAGKSKPLRFLITLANPHRRLRAGTATDNPDPMLTLIKNANVLAPEPLGHLNLLIGAGRILWMGEDKPSLDPRLLAEEVDLEGLWLTPGLIDGHAHITGGGGEAGFATRVPPVPLSQFTGAGVTSVVGLLGTDDVTRSTSSLIAQVRALREEGMSAWCYTGGYHCPPTTLTGSVRSDLVHIDCVLGLGELAISDHRSSQPTFDELVRLASEVHVAGLMTGKAGVLHLHLGDGERGLSLVNRALDETELPPRVFHPTHINRRRALFEEACELSKRGCWVDLTAFPPSDDTDEVGAAAAIGEFLAAGYPADKLTISSDGGGCLPVFDKQGELVKLDFGRSETLLQTLRQLLQNGQPLGRILPVFTSNIATLLRLAGKGRLQEGADADLLCLDETGELRHVMALGRWHVRDGEQVIKGTFET